MISLNVIPNIQLVVLQFLYYIRWLKNQKAPSPSYEIYFDNLEFKRIGFFVKSIELYSGRVKRYFYKVQRKAFNQFTIILQSSYLIVYFVFRSLFMETQPWQIRKSFWKSSTITSTRSTMPMISFSWTDSIKLSFRVKKNSTYSRVFHEISTILISCSDLIKAIILVKNNSFHLLTNELKNNQRF